MKGIAGWIAITAFLGGCVTAGDDAAFRISDVRQGLARVEAQDKGTIYSEGTKFQVTRNGECLAVGKAVPCMWFAIAFDYASKSDTTILTCTTAFDEPMEAVDPAKSHGKAREFSGPIMLSGKTGRAFWPGYITIDDEEGPSRSTTVCLLEGKEVLRVNFTFQ